MVKNKVFGTVRILAHTEKLPAKVVATIYLSFVACLLFQIGVKIDYSAGRIVIGALIFIMGLSLGAHLMEKDNEKNRATLEDRREKLDKRYNKFSKDLADFHYSEIDKAFEAGKRAERKAQADAYNQKIYDTHIPTVDVDLAMEMAKIMRDKEDITLDDFFARFNVPHEARSDFAATIIINNARSILDGWESN